MENPPRKQQGKQDETMLDPLFWAQRFEQAKGRFHEITPLHEICIEEKGQDARSGPGYQSVEGDLPITSTILLLFT